MKRLYLVAFAAGLVASLPMSLQAQTTTDTPASASTAPPASPAPAASPSASTPPADTPSNDTPRKKTAAKRTKSLPKAMTQEEINHSMESGTVPSRYRKNVPKEYQQYVPFEKQ